jgi:catechol 2,3-dioxygenase-like lactoylglutathione lyase family enzyme
MITGLNHVTLAVKEIERSFSFYRDILEFVPLCKWEGSAYFLVGTSDQSNGVWLCLDRDTHRQMMACSTHYAFSVSSDNFKTMSERIINSGAVIFKENTSPGNSLYFLDPDGHKLEIHTGDWQTRIAAKKENPGNWTNVEWFV